jgi:hypothetical protein
MTASPVDPHRSGTTLLTIARRLLTEPMVVAIIEPTIADFQCELTAAGANRFARLRARWRGYRAFWTLVLVAAVAPWALPAHDAAAPQPLVALVGTGATILALAAVVNPVLGATVTVVGAAGGLCAVLLHAWYQRHPSILPMPSRRLWRTPQINFSSTEVAANGGGLIFVIGSVFVVVLAVPSVLLFLIAGTLAGGLVARGLVEWRTRHPDGHLPEIRIGLR